LLAEKMDLVEGSTGVLNFISLKGKAMFSGKMWTAGGSFLDR